MEPSNDKYLRNHLQRCHVCRLGVSVFLKKRFGPLKCIACKIVKFQYDPAGGQTLPLDDKRSSILCPLTRSRSFALCGYPLRWSVPSTEPGFSFRRKAMTFFDKLKTTRIEKTWERYAFTTSMSSRRSQTMGQDPYFGWTFVGSRNVKINI